MGLNKALQFVCRPRRGFVPTSACSARRACFTLLAAVLVGVPALTATEAGAGRHRDVDRSLMPHELTAQPRTLLTVRRTVTGVATAGMRIAFYEYDISCAKAPRCNSDTIDLWSRRTKHLRRYRDPCPGEEWIVISGQVVYWECDELGASVQRTRIFLGLPGQSKTLVVAKSNNTMSLAGDGQQAFFSNGRRMWRLDGARRRVVLRGTSAYGEILDIDSGRILFRRYDDGRLLLLDRTGRVLHVFSAKFDCCSILSGNELMRETDAGVLEIYDVNSETLTRRLDVKRVPDPSLSDVKHGFALHDVEEDGFRILNMATGKDTLIRMRGNDFEGSATLGPDGVYYAEQLRGRGRIQLVTYAQLRNP
jgi:hypothetical protein